MVNRKDSKGRGLAFTDGQGQATRSSSSLPATRGALTKGIANILSFNPPSCSMQRCSCPHTTGEGPEELGPNRELRVLPELSCRDLGPPLPGGGKGAMSSLCHHLCKPHKAQETGTRPATALWVRHGDTKRRLTRKLSLPVW